MQYIKDPMAIEMRSMEIIAPYLTAFHLDEQATKVYSRIIHAAGDPDYANIIRLHPQAIAAGLAALTAGCNIFCDVEMVRTGINKRRLAELGGQAFCLVADETVAREAKAAGITRSMAAMRKFGAQLNGAIVAIGNAPTALFEVMQMIKEQNIKPALIVGVPVGFVGAAESKELLHTSDPVPYITVLGNKGGSPIAAAAVNAMMYMLGR
ncbi:precorrin-8X methylmutase [Sporomusa acidovorans]|uniref:Cobalt-precorrin-8 methylmutase n=1 Tax=Sporomusa acidovorans (strain ATCC 49682 / DSM 3132 / Mol) TaxID=1123286 RepID=A0ABZ3J1W6_SPOA4|nr:precorrin-8X methylmutase [Sporomusa acidovorans]OZC15055.1 precorrin-8X methylmutase [Sporomusa acidovorans DSM 3132]SDE84764.1 precorrin-8X methylmutase [Sporomusa acidovorans]